MADAADTIPASVRQFALTAEDLNTTVNHEPRIEDLRLARALGMSQPREIRRLIERHREALERFGEVCVTVTQTSKAGGRPGRTFWLNKRQCLYLCTKSETANATEATIQMVEVFDAYLAGSLAKSVYVRPHKRARPKLSAPAPTFPIPASPSVDRDGFAVMRLGGEILIVNLMDLAPAPGSRAVVIGWDKTILVEDMSEARSNKKCMGERNFILPHPTDTKFPRSVYAVGMVVASQPATAPTKTAPAKTRAGRAPSKVATAGAACLVPSPSDLTHAAAGGTA